MRNVYVAHASMQGSRLPDKAHLLRVNALGMYTVQKPDWVAK